MEIEKNEIQHDERQEILKALEAYGEKHNAEYYCIILTPPEGKKLRILGSLRHFSTKRGEAGMIIEGVVEKEVLSLPTER